MSNKKLTQINRLTLSIILLSLMLIVSYVEALFPFSISGFGIKIGLSNIMTILGLLLLDEKITLLINVLRLLIMGILFGNLIRFGISVSGFIFSYIVLLVFLTKFRFSITTSSMFGAVAHNIGQIVAISVFTKNIGVISLVPIYIIIGIFTGVIVGIISSILYEKLKLIVFD